ncbi:DUF4215 domain-containing protein [Myxococcus sp. Y35]|uniref:DUF4215 domain-containing protein n=1 Tax=Pseudomyxococcus flavus TaxID=3115648 RepID=UPI003CF4B5A3
MVNKLCGVSAARSILAALVLVLSACGDGDEPSPVDSGTLPDASVPSDSGTEDGGLVEDAGTEPDSGTALDSGTDVDAGSEPDSGTDPDAGSAADAGSSACGDGVVQAPESCDDGNTEGGDGCSATCGDIEPGWTCPTAGGLCAAAMCGDGLIAGTEECEDGNAANGDGCNSSCRLEEGWHCPTVGEHCVRTVCGDGEVQGTEQCDDGNTHFGDGCLPDCRREPRCRDGLCEDVCGDGVILPGSTEACDDGNLRANDGCSPQCTLEPGFACVLVEDAPSQQISLPIVYRDFRGDDLPATSSLPRGHIDFQNKNGAERGIVQSTLGSDGKPVYAKEGQPSLTTHGRAAFDQWYRDVPGVNQTMVSSLTLTRMASGAYRFDDPSFFPLDGLGWVAEGVEPTRQGTDSAPHNFHFTSETRSWFEYKGTEVLSFLGDDDVWVFINGRLALDLGGVHAAEPGSVTLSTRAQELGLVPGRVYEVALFQAERHTAGSSYQLTLSSFGTRRTECVALCGNGVIDLGEACDDGVNNNGAYGGCTRTCQLAPRCGDTVVQEHEGEECDDGNTTSRDGCSETCRLELP